MRLLNTLLVMGALHMGQTHAACPVQAEDGQTCREAQQRKFMVYDAASAQWVAPDRFLERRKQREGHPTWGVSRHYPPYEKVKELDTFTVLTRKGPCDMVFFHERWRRQADVWVWGEEMQNWRGCAVVFE